MELRVEDGDVDSDWIKITVAQHQAISYMGALPAYVDNFLCSLSMDLHKPNLILFPEHWLDAITIDFSNQESKEYLVLRKVAKIAQQHAVYILLGTLLEKPSPDELYITSVLLSPDGEFLGTYRKRRPTQEGNVSSGKTVGCYSALSPNNSTSSRSVLQSQRIFKLGIMICFDIENEDVRSELLSQHPDIILNPTYIPRPSTSSTAAPSVWKISMEVMSREFEQRCSTQNFSLIRCDMPFPSASGTSQVITPVGTYYSSTNLSNHFSVWVDVNPRSRIAQHQSFQELWPAPERERTDRRDNTGARFSVRGFKVAADQIQRQKTDQSTTSTGVQYCEWLEKNSRVVAGSSATDGGLIKIWNIHSYVSFNLRSNSIYEQPVNVEKKIDVVCLNTNTIATLSESGVIQILQITNTKVQVKIESQIKAATKLVKMDENRVGVVTTQGELYVMDVRTGSISSILSSGSRYDISTADYNPSNQKFALASSQREQCIRIIDDRYLKESSPVTVKGNVVKWCNDNLIISRGNKVTVFNETRAMEKMWSRGILSNGEDEYCTITAVEGIKNGSAVVATANDGIVRIFGEAKQVYWEGRAHDQGITGVKWNGKDKLITWSNKEDQWKLWSFTQNNNPLDLNTVKN